MPVPARGSLMKWENRKWRIVGRSGATLGSLLHDLNSDGEVSGCLASDLTPEEGAVGICSFCANEPRQLVALELINKQEQVGRTRLVTASVCLPLCVDCCGRLTSDLKLTVG